jgi:acetyl-CoA carboxylase biotin carboxyl carrier protein
MPTVIRAVVTGTVIRVSVDVGADVVAGQTVALMESMKMEIPIISESSGRVASIHVSEGEATRMNDPLVSLEVDP